MCSEAGSVQVYLGCLYGTLRCTENIDIRLTFNITPVHICNCILSICIYRPAWKYLPLQIIWCYDSNWRVWSIRLWDILVLGNSVNRWSVSNGSGRPGFGPGWNRSAGCGLSQPLPRSLNWVICAGLLPRTWFHFMVPTTLAVVWLQLGFWVLIISWPAQYVDCAVLAALSPPAFRFAMRPISVESLWNKSQFEAKYEGFQ